MRYLQAVVAEAYNLAVSDEYSDPARRLWLDLADHSTYHASIIRRDFTVIEVDEPSPYLTAYDMFRDLDKGRIIVSSAHSEHPIWTVRENVAFRLVHDVMGHYAAHRLGLVADFSFAGEYNAFTLHAKTVRDAPPREYGPRDALFTEVVGQAAYALEFGHFGPQKVAFLW